LVQQALGTPLLGGSSRYRYLKLPSG
jgi:hypothetical protein